MSKPILYAFSAASLAAILSASGLIPQFSKPDLAEQVETCLKKSDYVCLAEIGYKYPPDTKTEIHQRQAAETLAYLGKTNSAYALYEKLPADRDNHEIVSGILIYLLANDQAGEIDSLLDKISDSAEKIAILNSAMGRLTKYRPSIKHPKLLGTMKQIAKSQLEKILQSGEAIASIKHSHALAKTHPQEMLQLTKQLEDPEEATRFAAKLEKSIQREKDKNDQITAIKALLLEDKTEAAIEKLRILTDRQSDPEFYASNYAGFLRTKAVHKLWYESDATFRDTFAKAVIKGSKALNDPSCQSYVRENLALLYTFGGQKDKALALLERYRQEEPKAYHIVNYKSYCAQSGYFSTSVLQMMLGDDSEFKRDDYLTQFPHASVDSRVELQSEAPYQALSMLVRAIQLSTPQSRDRITHFYKSAGTALTSEQTKSSTQSMTFIDAKSKSFVKISPREKDTHLMLFIDQAIHAGDYDHALRLTGQRLKKLKQFIPNDQPKKLTQALRNRLIRPLIFGMHIREGFLRRAIGS